MTRGHPTTILVYYSTTLQTRKLVGQQSHILVVQI